MKKMKFFFIFASLVLMATSCKWDDAEYIDGNRTTSGRDIFSYTENMIMENLRTLNIAQSVNLYMRTTDPIKQLDLGRELFYNYKIEVIDSKCIISASGEVWEFSTGGVPLEDAGAIWSVTHIYRPSKEEYEVYIPENGFIITCTGAEQWSVKSKNMKDYFFAGNAELDILRTVKRDQKSYVNSDYTVAGSGNFRTIDEKYKDSSPGQFLDVNYVISSTMEYWFNTARYREEFITGKVEMIVNSAKVKDDNISADLTKSEGTRRIVEITQRGVTERFERSYFYFD